MKKQVKATLTVIVLVLTVASFSYYLHKHPEIITQLKHLPILTLASVLVLYGAGFVAWVLVTRTSLRLYNKRLGVQENFLFNAYSSLINFFGPGQSGPLFRGAYLKKRHGLNIKPYIFTLLVYYAFFGVISVMLVFIGTRPWWQTAVLIAGAAGGSLAIVRWWGNKNKNKMGDNRLSLSPRTLGLLFAATVLQLAVQVAIFGVELHNVGAHASFGQVLSYTGVASLSLFVAITPGAIGIREAFLAFSQNLHHIGGNAIVAANIVDRASYIVFLGILFVGVIALHAKDKLNVKQLDLDKPKGS
ncbi:MAG: lysylphosphatidylglycerol synthase transmembrane domain-containing protein [Candidatus Saccharimonadales bacterium]